MGLDSEESWGKKETLARITIHIPKSEAPKMENMFAIGPKILTDFVTKSRSLRALESKKKPTQVTVSL